jgi:hypothetical protein
MNLTRWSGDTRISEVVDSDLTAAEKRNILSFLSEMRNIYFLVCYRIVSFSHLTQTKGNIGTLDLSPI